MMSVIAIYTQELKPEDVINMVEKLTSSYYDALSFILTAISIILAFAFWDRSTMKKAIQKEFEVKLEKETEKIKQEMQTKVDELLEKANKTVETNLVQETDRVKQEMQTKVDELVETSNKTFDEKLKQSSKQMWDLAISVEVKAKLWNETSFTRNMIVHPRLKNYSKIIHFKNLTSTILDMLNHLEKQQINDLLYEDIWETFLDTARKFNKLIRLLYKRYKHDKDSIEDRKKSKPKIKEINDTIDNINTKIADYPYFKDMDVTKLSLNKINETKLFAGSKQSKPNKTN